MNALILSAVWGVILMFGGAFIKSKRTIRNLAIVGLIVLLLVNVLEIRNIEFFKIDTKGMLAFDRFALLFNTIVFTSALLFLLLSARDMEKVGINYAEYLALIFFILSGIILVAAFKSLLILFLGIEIISIPF